LQESLACNPFPDSFKSFPCRTFQATAQCAAANILELNIDEFLRITTVENISGYVNAAGFPNRITIL